MAFDGVPRAVLAQSAASAVHWRRDERLALLVGGAAFGGLAGFFLSIWAGRLDFWTLAVMATPLLAMDLYLTGLTLTRAFERRAHGCAMACVLHAAAVLAWPISAMATPLAAAAFWFAPGIALTALVLFASCWSGEGRALYRMGAQGALVAALMAQQGVFVALGG